MLFSFLRYLNFYLDFFDHVGKRLDKKAKIKLGRCKLGNKKLLLPNILRSKGNQMMNFCEFIDMMKNIFLKKSYTKIDGETSPRPFSENQN